MQNQQVTYSQSSGKLDIVHSLLFIEDKTNNILMLLEEYIKNKNNGIQELETMYQEQVIKKDQVSISKLRKELNESELALFEKKMYLQLAQKDLEDMKNQMNNQTEQSYSTPGIYQSYEETIAAKDKQIMELELAIAKLL
ncbi:hypothetical protein WA158_007562 [Blastocystis sp. Blastoise]